MVGYGVILDAEVMLQDADRKPVSASLLFRLRDNPLATREGSTGAPKYQTAAFNDLAVNTPKLEEKCVTSGKFDTSGTPVVTAAKIGAGEVSGGKLDTTYKDMDSPEALLYFNPEESGGAGFAHQDHAFVPIAKSRTVSSTIARAEFVLHDKNDVFRTSLVWQEDHYWRHRHMNP